MGSNSSLSSKAGSSDTPWQEESRGEGTPSDRTHPTSSEVPTESGSVDSGFKREIPEEIEKFYTNSISEWLENLAAPDGDSSKKQEISRAIASFYLKCHLQEIIRDASDVKNIFAPSRESPIAQYPNIDHLFDSLNPEFARLIHLCQCYITGDLQSLERNTHKLHEQSHQEKIRFSNIIPYKYNHISMMGNWISSNIGAIQWPLPDNLPDLYRELSTRNVHMIISLGPIVDTVYWDPSEIRKFNKTEASRITFHSTFQPQRENHSLQQGSMKIDGDHTVKLIRYEDWEDYEAPREDALDAVIRLAACLRLSSTEQKVFVHCRAGVGRTGTLILIANCWKEWEEKGLFDVIFELFKLRLRRVRMVQQQNQLAYVYTAMLYIISKGIKLSEFKKI